MIAGDVWPEAYGAERERRRPGLDAVVALCDAYIAAEWSAIPDLAECWLDKETT